MLTVNSPARYETARSARMGYYKHASWMVYYWQSLPRVGGPARWVFTVGVRDEYWTHKLLLVRVL